MLHPDIQARPLYGIGTVSRLTGVKPDTLRIWERRYDLGASYKSGSGRRQYTQADLEHLQLVAALIAEGARIGEIAASERKTLEMLLRARTGADSKLPQAKPRVLFVGSFLCGWLDEHQGCLVNIDALLARVEIAQLSEEMLQGLGNIDALVVGCSTLGHGQLALLQQLRGQLQPATVLCVYQTASEHALQALQRQEVAALAFPPEPAQLTFHLAPTVAKKEGAAGYASLGELVPGRERIYSDSDLAAAGGIEGQLAGTAPADITELIRALAEFEEQAASSSVQGWNDAAAHACIYAYAGQARWLLEKSLGVVLDHQLASAEAKALA